jgi:hypothetical protein
MGACPGDARMRSPGTSETSGRLYAKLAIVLQKPREAEEQYPSLIRLLVFLLPREDDSVRDRNRAVCCIPSVRISSQYRKGYDISGRYLSHASITVIT